MKIIKKFFTLFTFAFLLATCSESTTSSPSVDPNIPAPTLPTLYYTNKKGTQIASVTAIWGEATNLRPVLINLPGEATATGYALKAGSSALPKGLSLHPTTGIISGNLNHASSLDNHESTIEVTLSDGKKLEVKLTFTVPLAELSYKDADDSSVSTVTAVVRKAINLTPSLDKAFSTVSASYKVKSGDLPSDLTINPTSGVISGTLNAEVDNVAVTIEATLNGVTKIEKIITFNVNALTLVYTNVKKDEIIEVVAKAGVSTNLSPKKDNIPTGDGITALYAFKGNTTAATNGLKINTTTGLISGVFDKSFTNNITVKLTLTINRVETVLEKAITFEIEPAETPFPARYGHQVVAYKDEMYLIGGYDGAYKNNVWKSTNGANWVEVTKAAAFSARRFHQVVVYKDEMYLIAGNDGAIKNDVWKSSDGGKWVEVTKAAAFSARWGHQVVVLGGEMYLIGGWSTDKKGDVWKSSNGKVWNRLIEYAPFVLSTGDRRIIYNHQVVVLNNKTMYLIAGVKGWLISQVNDVYSSTDGATWSKVMTTIGVFTARERHQVVVLNKTMYLTGGDDGTTAFNDVYKSSDGTAWEELIINGDAPFSKRYNYQMVVLGGEMYLIGGYDGTNNLKDVWKSSNGTDWFLISK